MKTLITGGAGFIGSHITDALIARGDEVVVLDNLDPQVHSNYSTPKYLNPKVKFYKGDVRDSAMLAKCLENVEAVIYNAAAVGVGQSMYEVNHYIDVNCRGAAVFWETLIKQPHSVKKIILASSMSIYGEGSYVDKEGALSISSPRTKEQLANKTWEMLNAQNQQLAPIATTEEKILAPGSVYAISKRDQEELFLTLGKTYNIPVIAFRYFNVIGSRQSLSNPYTGVAAIFCSRILNGKPPLIFEDGLQLRDFVDVADIVQANLLALDNQSLTSACLNIGSGHAITVNDLAKQIALALKSDIQPVILNEARAGDIRHCYADITRANKLLGYQPQFSIDQSINRLVTWLSDQTANDKVDSCYNELKINNLVK